MSSSYGPKVSLKGAHSEYQKVPIVSIKVGWMIMNLRVYTH